MNAANVACRQMGCGPATSIYRYYSYSYFYEMICSGNESSLTECQNGKLLPYQYGYHSGVYCTAGLIRLVGPNRCSGRVEIYNNGSWGTVCNVSKDLKDARVFCRQLGCGTALGLLHFGEGAGQIWLDDVACTWNERYFSECMRNGSVRQDCAHSEDLGVICS
ncbi:hypothetical protein XENOCAPTIV_007156, partial [Xenoophorus captivus]